MATLTRGDFTDGWKLQRERKEVKLSAGTALIGMLSASARLGFAIASSQAAQASDDKRPEMGAKNTRRLIQESLIDDAGDPIFRSDAEVRRWLDSVYGDDADTLITEIIEFNRLTQASMDEAEENFTETPNDDSLSS